MADDVELDEVGAASSSQRRVSYRDSYHDSSNRNSSVPTQSNRNSSVPSNRNSGVPSNRNSVVPSEPNNFNSASNRNSRVSYHEDSAAATNDDNNDNDDNDDTGGGGGEAAPRPVSHHREDSWDDDIGGEPSSRRAAHDPAALPSSRHVSWGGVETVDPAQLSRSGTSGSIRISTRDDEYTTDEAVLEQLPDEPDWLRLCIDPLENDYTQDTARYFDLFFYPTWWLVFVSVLMPLFVGLSLTVVGTPYAVAALRRFAYAFDERPGDRQFFSAEPATHESVARWRRTLFWASFAVACVPMTLVAAYELWFAFLTSQVALGLLYYMPTFLAISAFAVIFGGRRVGSKTLRELRQSLRQSNDFMLRVVVWAVYPAWDVRANVVASRDRWLLCAYGLTPEQAAQRPDAGEPAELAAQRPDGVGEQARSSTITSTKSKRGSAGEIGGGGRHSEAETQSAGVFWCAAIAWFVAIQVVLPGLGIATDVAFFIQVLHNLLHNDYPHYGLIAPAPSAINATFDNVVTVAARLDIVPTSIFASEANHAAVAKLATVWPDDNPAYVASVLFSFYLCAISLGLSALYHIYSLVRLFIQARVKRYTARDIVLADSCMTVIPDVSVPASVAPGLATQALGFARNIADWLQLLATFLFAIGVASNTTVGTLKMAVSLASVTLTLGALIFRMVFQRVANTTAARSLLFLASMLYAAILPAVLVATVWVFAPPVQYACPNNGGVSAVSATCGGAPAQDPTLCASFASPDLVLTVPPACFNVSAGCANTGAQLGHYDPQCYKYAFAEFTYLAAMDSITISDNTAGLGIVIFNHLTSVNDVVLANNTALTQVTFGAIHSLQTLTIRNCPALQLVSCEGTAYTTTATLSLDAATQKLVDANLTTIRC